MAFELEKLFVDVSAPRSGDVVTVMYDLPHREIRDDMEWQERRVTAEDWHRWLATYSNTHEMLVNPVVAY